MSDDLTKTSPHGALRVNVNEDDELDYWAEKFGVSREKLIQTAERVGPLVKDVAEALNGTVTNQSI